MTGFVDTNILIRHLTGDPPALARRASAYLARAEGLLVADLVVAETVYVLESFYEVPRHDVATAIRALLALPSVLLVDADLILRAIEVYETARIDFAESYLVACAETTGVAVVVSFDRSIDRVGTVSRVEPPGP